MSLESLIYHYKGSAGSGDWAHKGRPPRRGGSGGGGGLSTIGLDSTSSPEQRRGVSRVVRTAVPKYDAFIEHYNLKDLCNKKAEECHGLKVYSGSNYSDINKSLRKQETDYPNIPSTNLSANEVAIAAMDKAFDTFPKVPKDVKVYRHVSPEVISKMTQGTVFKDHAYVSTTITPGDGNIEIRIPKGSKGIFIDDISSYPGENELLLNRGSRFRILKNDKSGVVAELISED